MAWGEKEGEVASGAKKLGRGFSGEGDGGQGEGGVLGGGASREGERDWGEGEGIREGKNEVDKRGEKGYEVRVEG